MVRSSKPLFAGAAGLAALLVVSVLSGQSPPAPDDPRAPRDLAEFLARVHDHGIELKEVRVYPNVYLTEHDEATLTDLAGLVRLPEYLHRWHGTVAVTLQTPERGSVVRVAPEERDCDYCFVTGRFVVYGDPPLVQRLRAAVK